MAKKDLVQIIRDNPGCVAIIDNDSWTLYKQSPYTPPNGIVDEDAWERDIRLCDDGNVKRLGDGGYGSGNCYGGDILQALAVIVGIKIESV